MRVSCLCLVLSPLYILLKLNVGFYEYLAKDFHAEGHTHPSMRSTLIYAEYLHHLVLKHKDLINPCSHG